MVAKKEHHHQTGCPIACGLDIIGDHWTLLIIRNLMFLGLHEYKEMLQKEEKISTNILTDRLKKLECAGVIDSMIHPENSRRKFYYLTVMGKDLVELMVDLVLWSNKYLTEYVKIPRKKREELEKGRKQFIRKTLMELEAWESENLT